MESYNQVDPFRRLMAGSIDFLSAFLVVVGVEIVLRSADLSESSHSLVASLLLTDFGALKTRIIAFLVFFFVNWKNFAGGQTIGMKLMYYKVVMKDDRPVSMASMLIRQFIFFFTMINPLRVTGGFLLLNRIMLNYTGTVLHDWIVGTKVVYK